MKKPTNKQMSAALGITIRRITELKRAGMPTDTTEAAQSWRNDREHGDDSVKRLRIERIALVSEQRRRAQIENRVRLGGLVDAGQVKHRKSVHLGHRPVDEHREASQRKGVWL